MNKIISVSVVKVILITLAVCGLALVLTPDISFAQDSLAGQAQQGVDDAGGGSGGAKLEDVISTVVNFLLFLIAVIAVIMIIIGGIRYTVSGGDANATKGARDTILYAVIGLVVAMVAFGIVNFVVDLF